MKTWFRIRVKRPHRDGFTLVELLVVIGIIALLTVLASNILYSSREEAMATTCKAQLKQLGTQLTQETLNLYNTPAAEAGGGTRTVTLPCGCEIDIPLDGDPPSLPVKLDGCPKAPPNPLYEISSLDETRTLSYGTIDMLSVDMNQLPEHEQWLIACSEFQTITDFEELAFERHKDTVNVFFYDGHVDRVPQDYMPWPGRDRDRDPE